MDAARQIIEMNLSNGKISKALNGYEMLFHKVQVLKLHQQFRNRIRSGSRKARGVSGQSPDSCMKYRFLMQEVMIYLYIMEKGLMGMSRTRSTVYAGMFVALMAVGAFIKIMLPVGPFMVTFSLQFLFALLAGMFLGAKIGFLSVLSYLIVGLIGVPVFAHGGGIGYVLKPTFGFLIGFAAAALLTGFVVQKTNSRKFIPLLVAAFVGELSYYFCGLAYYYLMFNFLLPDTGGIGFVELMSVWFLSTVLPDFGLCVLASLIASRLLPKFKEMNLI